MNELIIFAERCVHQAVTGASCDACARACPKSAWKLNHDGLTFDSEVCDSCGLCVAVCPGEALALPQVVPVQRKSQAGNDVLIACECADSMKTPYSCQSDNAGQTPRRQLPVTARFVPMDDSKLPARAGVTPCLQALTPHWVLKWAGSHAGSRVRYASGDCEHCLRGRGPSWQDRFAVVATGLHAVGRPVPQLQRITFQDWLHAVTPQPEPDAGRRGLFRAMLSPSRRADSSTPLQAMTSARAPLLQLLRDQGAGRALWAVVLDRERCTWCMACVQLCDSGALQFVSEAQPLTSHGKTQRKPIGLRDSAGRFALDMQHCTGCGVCVDACDHGALRHIAAPGSDQQTKSHIGLDLSQCTQCGVGFHHLRRSPSTAPIAGAVTTSDETMMCPACKQGRPKKHDRWVQNGECT